MCNGRLFHRRATGNALSPTVVGWVHQTFRDVDEAECNLRLASVARPATPPWFHYSRCLQRCCRSNWCAVDWSKSCVLPQKSSWMPVLIVFHPPSAVRNTTAEVFAPLLSSVAVQWVHELFQTMMLMSSDMISVPDLSTAVLPQGKPRDAAVNFDTYGILQRHRAVSLPQHALLHSPQRLSAFV